MGDVKKAKAFLKQVKVYDTHITNLLEDRDKIWCIATKITSTVKGDVVAVGSSGHDKIGDAASKLLDLRSEIDRAVDAYIAKKQEVDSVLVGIKDANQLRVLHLHYFGVLDERTQKVRYLKWDDIAEKMNYTKRHITRLHGWALQRVAELLKENEQ